MQQSHNGHNCISIKIFRPIHVDLAHLRRHLDAERTEEVEDAVGCQRGDTENGEGGWGW